MAVDYDTVSARGMELLAVGRVSYTYLLSTHTRWKAGLITLDEYLYRLEHPEEFRTSEREEWYFARGKGWRPIVTVKVREGLL